MNQSQFLAITCNSLEAREKSRVRGAIDFGFDSHWLKNWRESFKPITKRSNRNHVITFDSHLKTALFIGVVGTRAFCVERLVVFTLAPPLLFPLFINVTFACLLGGLRSHGWVVRICQPSVQSPSWSWLPIVEAPRCVRHQNLLSDAVVKQCYTSFV